MQEYEGYYSLDTFLLMVRVRNGRLTVAESGVPAGYEMLLEPTGAPHTFTLSRADVGRYGRFPT